MDSNICNTPDCKANSVVHVRRVMKRHVADQSHFCADHIQSYLDEYAAMNDVRDGVAEIWNNAVAFDIELVLCEEREDLPSQFTLGEVGGKRRLDCQTGPFETWTLARELERQPAPRPLTHRAMASVIVACGGRLARVVIDKLLVADRIYESKLHISQNTEDDIIVDARISDAVILAVICDAPIFVSHRVLENLNQT